VDRASLSATACFSQGHKVLVHSQVLHVIGNSSSAYVRYEKNTDTFS